MTNTQAPEITRLPPYWDAGLPDPAAEAEYYAGVPMRRSVAYFVDLLLIAAMMAVAAVVFGILGVLSFGLLSPVLWLVFGLIPLAYHTWFIGGPRSATLGMQLFGVEVRRIDGGRPDYILAALQTIAFYVSVSLTSWLILLIALFNRRGRCLHDWLCGTVAIRSLPWPRSVIDGEVRQGWRERA